METAGIVLAIIFMVAFGIILIGGLILCAWGIRSAMQGIQTLNKMERKS